MVDREFSQTWEVGGDRNLIVRYTKLKKEIAILRYEDEGYSIEGIYLTQKELNNIIVLLDSLVSYPLDE